MIRTIILLISWPFKEYGAEIGLALVIIFLIYVMRMGH